MIPRLFASTLFVHLWNRISYLFLDIMCLFDLMEPAFLSSIVEPIDLEDP